MSVPVEKIIVPFKCFEGVRLKASGFCQERNWEKFHKPPSIALALAGECGEVCEIFQWKGEMESTFSLNDPASKGLTESEILHTGEEIADVFIYTTRLCDLCGIDFGAAVEQQARKYSIETNSRKSPNEPWQEVEFQTIADSLVPSLMLYRSPRHVVFALQTHAGHLSNLFAKYPESDSTPGLKSWAPADLLHLNNVVGSIGVTLCILSLFYNLSLGYVVARKFKKNEEKYPANLAKGSSAKYTAYSQNNVRPDLQVFFSTKWFVLLLCAGSFCIGRFAKFPRNLKF